MQTIFAKFYKLIRKKCDFVERVFFTDALARDGPSSVPDTLEMLWICFYRRLSFYIFFRNAACEVQGNFTNATCVRYFYKLMRFAPTKLLVSKKKT